MAKISVQEDPLDNSEYCETVLSQQGHIKINVRGYLMVKDKLFGSVIHWCCQKRKSLNCRGRASTTMYNGRYKLLKCTEHNHGPVASEVSLAKLRHGIKRKASLTRDHPCEILQQTYDEAPMNIQPYLPSKDAVRMMVRRERRRDRPVESNHLNEIGVPENRPVEPKHLNEFEVPESLQRTLSGEDFFLMKVDLDDDVILLFTTKINVQRLSAAKFWIMDGTFKQVPHLPYQMYTIHAPVGDLHCLPLVYALLTSKKEELYRRMLEEVTDYASINDIELNPEVIITDLELALINAAKNEYPRTAVKTCNFHLGQCIWRKLETLGYAARYDTDENFSLKLRHLLALAFLPANEIPDAFLLLRPLLHEVNDLMEWFEQNYIRYRTRTDTRNNSQYRVPPLFPPILWSVHDSIANGIPRTQNHLEAWHRRWENLIGTSDLSIYRIIEQMQEEQHQVDAQVEMIVHGEPQPKMEKELLERQERILTVFHGRENRSVLVYLRGVARNTYFN